MSVSITKTVRAAIAGSALLMGLALQAPHAHAQSATGTYVGIGAGLNMPNSSATTVDGSLPTGLDFHAGYNVLGTIGYKWNRNIRTELEIDFRHAGIDNINGLPAAGDQGTFSFSGNVLYDIPVSNAVTPYLGGGIGVAREHFGNVNGAGLVNAGGFNPAFDDSTTRFQWQLIGGVNTPIAGHASLFAEYRFIGVSSATFGSPTGDYLQGHYDHSSNILVGLRFFL